MNRVRISLTSGFLLDLTTSPQCPTPQPVNGLLLMARGCHVVSNETPASLTPAANTHPLYAIDNVHIIFEHCHFTPPAFASV